MSRHLSKDEGDGKLPSYFETVNTTPNTTLKLLTRELEKRKSKESYSLKAFFSYTTRLETFSSWSTLHALSPDVIARAGFCYTGIGEICICPWCERLVTKWNFFDEPFNKHKEISPFGCNYLDYIFPQPSYNECSLDSSPPQLVIDEDI